MRRTQVSVVRPDKAEGAFRIIGEVSEDTGVAQHILRYWEQKFPQIRPIRRGNRRYYRPSDVALILRIKALRYDEGRTIAEIQAMLKRERA